VTAPRWERAAGFRARVRDREPVFGTFLAMGSAVSAEQCGLAGMDWCLVDLEHGLGSEATLHAELAAVELTGAAALVRVESASPLRISRALDHGAAGIMIPQLRSAADAAAAVRCVRYPPSGARGVALSVRGAGYGRARAGDVGTLSDAVTTLIQIENGDSLGAVDEIAAVDGVDVLFVGPNDLTHSLGIPGEFADPRYLDGLAAVARAARAGGCAAGVMLSSPDQVAAHLALGYTFFALSTDGGLLAGAVRTALATMREQLR
jgi:2-keto-3-deoxy-L-rhamnonate aldolase RhmA